MTEMHDVVDMLLNRIKDYPEDFVSIDNLTGITYRANENKWTKAYGLAKQGATEEEQVLLEAVYKEAKRAVYMGAALKTILSDEEPEEGREALQITNPWMSTTGLSQAQLTSTSTTSSINLITELEAKQKAMEAQMQRQYAMMNAYNTTGQIG